MTFAATDRFDPFEMQSLMQMPEIYWQASDALAPQPEEMDFVGHMAHPHTWTLAATYDAHIIGYVQFVRRTSIGAEIHTGFHPQFRGNAIPKKMCEYAIGQAFIEKQLHKLWAIIASDNVGAVRLARTIGFEHEGRIKGAIVRAPEMLSDRTREFVERRSNSTPFRDLLILGLSK